MNLESLKFDPKNSKKRPLHQITSEIIESSYQYLNDQPKPLDLQSPDEEFSKMLDQDEDFQQDSELGDQVYSLQENPDTVIDIFEHGSSISGDAMSIHFSNGKQVLSDSTHLHQWKPDYNLRREEYWDKKMLKFSCARGSDATGNDDALEVNKQIIAQLEKLKSLYEVDGERGKAMGYKKAISMIKSIKEPITSTQQVEKLPGVGAAITQKVQEFLDSGQMSKIKFLQSDEKLQILEELASIWGVGPNLAVKLQNVGIKSISDLRENQQHLNKLQVIGLKYHEDI